MPDRRVLLRGLAALPAVAAAPATAATLPPVPSDPLAALWKENRLIRARIDADPDDVPEDHALITRLRWIDREACHTRATAPEGGVAALEWVIYEFREYHATEILGDQLILWLLDEALSVLRRFA